jgi:hypothetical protein
MLYLHCGWPRTSTSSLQAALFAHRDLLAGDGIVFPERWLSATSPTHHGLSTLLSSSLESTAPLDEFGRFLDLHANQDVLFSAEALTFWLLSSPKQEALSKLVEAARGTMAVTCVWTLRRLDEVLSSLYLFRLALGEALPPPADHLDRIRLPDRLFEGLRKLEVASAGDVVYVRYDPAGAHNRRLLGAFGLSGRVEAAVRMEIDRGPRLNASLTRKQAAALINLDALSAKSGIALDRGRLGEMFRRGGFGFAGDDRCELADAGTRATFHARALAAADRQGFAPYGEFFADAEIEGPSAVALDADVLTEEDLARLTAHLTSASP